MTYEFMSLIESTQRQTHRF